MRKGRNMAIINEVLFEKSGKPRMENGWKTQMKEKNCKNQRCRNNMINRSQLALSTPSCLLFTLFACFNRKEFQEGYLERWITKEKEVLEEDLSQCIVSSLRSVFEYFLK